MELRYSIAKEWSRAEICISALYVGQGLLWDSESRIWYEVIRMTLKDETKDVCRRLSALYGEITDEDDRKRFEVLLGVLICDIDSFGMYVRRGD